MTARYYPEGSPEGLAEARRRIAEAGRTGAVELDIGGLGLVEMPKELLELTQLKVLYLGLPKAAADKPRSERTEEDEETCNAVRALPPALFASLLHLAKLHLELNRLTALPDTIGRAAQLTALDLGGYWDRGNRIGDDGARALSQLVNLTQLNLKNNNIGDDGARALGQLVNLTQLNLWGNSIGADGARALAPLVNLTQLNLERNHIGDDGARALGLLVNLTQLNLGGNRIGDDGARALGQFVNLTQLDLWNNGIGDDGARALGPLVNLTQLNLGGNGIGDDGARALGLLVNLTQLNLGSNGIGDDGARALGPLVNLTQLDLGDTGVKNLSPLRNLTKLASLNCTFCELDDAYLDLWMMPSLVRVYLQGAVLPGVPAEVLGGNCLDRLRAHIADLAAGCGELTDVKLMFLGNGRVGKTQIARRLRGELYDDQEPSTHGVRVSSGATPMSRNDTTTFKIWDFGGQDIYHGTHALFLKTRAVCLLAWTPGSEAVQYHEHNGFAFRNEPLGYWLAYVRHFSGRQAPVLIVQTQCDRPEQEVLRPPLPDDALAAFPFKKVLHYSAKEDRGRAALDEALADAVHWLRERQGVAIIGKGRAEVKAKLEKLYAKGKRLIAQAEFLKLCEKAGNISSPPLLLEYLHNIGTVFYREGLFGDAVILDQAWALDAVYAVFDRDSKAFANIQRAGGRFRRSELAKWVWKQHGEAEQELFISFMQQCDICFTHRKGDARVEVEYIAPDLLPARDDPVIAAQLREKWGDGPCEAEATLTYDLLPPGLMRSLIAKVGTEAGLAAEYWCDGFYFYDEKTRSRALVEQRLTSEWAGAIRVQTRHGHAEALLERLLEFIDERHDALGARTCDRRIAMHEPERRAEAPAIKPVHEPTPEPEWYVSYAWADAANMAREAEVDKLCAEAEARGKKIIRDKTDMRNGDRISKFMDRIGRGDRVFIFLSDKYLRSAYCMHELFDVWRNCREDASEFIARTRVFVLPDAKIGTVVERAQYAKHWRKTFAEIDTLVKEDGLDVIGDKGVADYRWMSRFVHETANMLELVQDTLAPRDFDVFLQYGFEAEPEPRSAT